MVTLIQKLTEAEHLLDSLVPFPPPPIIDYRIEKSATWISQQLEPLEVHWLQLDRRYFLTNQYNFLNIVTWDWTDSYSYVRELWDCDKFAVRFKSQVDLHFRLNQVGVVLDYGSGHAYNLVVFPDGNIMLLEPQSDVIFCWTKRLQIFYALTGSYVML